MDKNTETNNLNTPPAVAKKSFPIESIVIVILVLIIGFILFTRTSPAKKSSDSEQNNSAKILSELNANFSPIKSDEHILGTPEAKVFIVEYSDTECPFCKLFHSTMHKLVNESNGNISWVYRHYPIPQLHERAFSEAIATECAWAQGGNEIFWQYIDQIYARTNSNDSLDPSELYKIASDLNLDSKKFTTCMSTEEYKTKVENDIYSGQALKVNGTPTSFIVIDGKIVDTILGAQKYETILQKINEYLESNQ